MNPRFARAAKVAVIALTVTLSGSLTGRAAAAAVETTRCADVSAANARATHIVSHDDPTSSHLVACRIGHAIASKAKPGGGVWLVSTKKFSGGRYSASYARFGQGGDALTWWKWVCVGGPSQRGTRQWRCGRALGGLDSVTFRTSSPAGSRVIPRTVLPFPNPFLTPCRS